MKTHAFLFNWRRQYEKTKEKERQFAEQLPNVKLTVINSDDDHRDDGWVNIGEQAYMNDQILKAIELFDGDAMWIVLADASYDNWDKVLSKAEFSFEKYNWGVFAPNVDYTWHDSSRVDIQSMPIEDDLKFVSCTDCICWFIHKDMIDDYKASSVDMSKNKFGWGWDVVLPSFSIMRKRPVLRDYSNTIHHPKSTNYDSTEAELQMIDVYRSLSDPMQNLFGILRQQREWVRAYF